MSHAVELLEEVKTKDVPALVELDPKLVRCVAEIVAELKTNPWLGAEMWARPRFELVSNCRKVPFDVPSWKGKPRYRLVYRNDPDDGSIAVLTVLSVGERDDLAAYRAAVTRVAAELRDRPRKGKLNP